LKVHNFLIQYDKFFNKKDVFLNLANIDTLRQLILLSFISFASINYTQMKLVLKKLKPLLIANLDS